MYFYAPKNKKNKYVMCEVRYMPWAIRRGLTKKTDHQTLYYIIIQLRTQN